MVIAPNLLKLKMKTEAHGLFVAMFVTTVPTRSLFYPVVGVNLSSIKEFTREI
ncbi:hypothetical protein Golax_021370 [Gossypium laxum]|uniref:Uncharacterized protein n=3 Tax=Gossypium TaxID=3633 RepID=A0A7J9K2S8_9ROSI|nr:hypothetical protein [Gossypium lobatum]MBA0724697.1 hypothetical protein [Gossypium laxum]MBA0840703.1 hypothetical protein [Gossypium armourianum]